MAFGVTVDASNQALGHADVDRIEHGNIIKYNLYITSVSAILSKTVKGFL
jgi:hypothetical protein